MSNDRYGNPNGGWGASQNNGKYYSNMNNYNKNGHYYNNQPSTSNSHGKNPNFDQQAGSSPGDFNGSNHYHNGHGQQSGYHTGNHGPNGYNKYYDRYGSAQNMHHQGRGGYYTARGGSSARYGGKLYHYPYAQQQQPQISSHRGPPGYPKPSFPPPNVTTTPPAASASNSSSPQVQGYNYLAGGHASYGYHQDTTSAAPAPSPGPVTTGVEIISEDDHLKSSRIWAKLLKVTAEDVKGGDQSNIPTYQKSTFVKKFRKDLDDLDEINKKIREHEIIKVNSEFQFDNWTRIEKNTNLIYNLNNEKLEEMVNNEW